MGLGKTIQTAAFLEMLVKHQQCRGPFLIVCPLSTIVNWQRELLAWTTLDVVVYHGTTTERETIRQFEFPFLDKSKSGVKVDIVLTQFDACIRAASTTMLWLA